MHSAYSKDSRQTKYEALKQVEKTTGVRPAELDLPELPEHLGYLVDWAQEVCGAEPITFTEIKAWADLTLKMPSPLEVALLVRLDSIHQRVRHECNS